MPTYLPMGWDFGLKKRRVRSVNTTPNEYLDFTDADAGGRFYSHSVEFLGVDGLAYTTGAGGVKARVADNNCYPVVPNGGATDSTHPLSINWTGNSTTGYTVTVYSDLVSWSTPLDSLGGAHMAQANMFVSISEDSAGTGVGGTGPLPRPDQMQTAVTFNYAAVVSTDVSNPTGRGWDRVLTGLALFINGLFYYIEIDHYLVGNVVPTHYNGDPHILRFTPGEINGGVNYLILDAAAYGLSIPAQNVDVPLVIPWGQIILSLAATADPLTGRNYIRPPANWADATANYVANAYVGHETQSTYGTNTGLFRLAISGLAHTAVIPDVPVTPPTSTSRGTSAMRLRFYAPGQYEEHGDAPLFVVNEVLDYAIVVDQVNRFDPHQVTLAETWRDTVTALPAWATVDIEQVGLGDIARGIIESPEAVIDNRYSGKLVLTIPNLTDQCLDVTTGLGYADAQAIGQVVTNLGALPQKGYDTLTGYDPATGLAQFVTTPGAATGWSATFLDDGKTLNSASPVGWAAVVNAVTNGNIITKIPGSTPGYFFDGGTGTPMHLDATEPCSLQWQIVMPSVCQVGLRTDQGIGTPDWGFDYSAPIVKPDQTLAGTWTIIEQRTLTAITGPYAGNTAFSVSLTLVNGVPTIQYAINGLPVYTSAHTPFAPFVPVAFISAPSGEVDNLIFARTVPTSEAWFQVQYPSKPTQLAAFLQLATDTGMFVREAKDATGRPLRAFAFGPMNAPATVTARDGRGGTLDRMRANPGMRLIDEITSYKRDVAGYYTVATPLGGTTGTLQVTVELLWRILNDPAYQNYQGEIYGGLANIFPEYDPNFGIYRTGVTGTPEFYIRYEPAMSDPTTIKEGGPVAISQIVYPQQATIAQQEAAQRLLYVAYVEQMKRALRPHVTLAFTTLGDWYPPRAGDQLHIDYTKINSSVRDGVWAPVRILTGTDPVNNPDPRVLSVVRAASGDDMPMDTILVSNLGKYPDSVSSQAATNQRNIAAIQVTTANGSSTTLGNPSFAEIDADNPIVLPFYIPPNVFRITAFYFAFTFWPFRQPISDVTSDFDNPPGTQIYVTIGGEEILLATPGDLNAAAEQIAGMPAHVHNIGVVTGSSVAPDATTDYLGALHSGGRIVPYENTGGGGNIQTSTGIINIDLAPTSHGHPVARAGDIVAHIPAETALAPLPSHVHPIPPGIKNLTPPTGITFAIDRGDGVFLERTAQLTDTLSGRTGGTAFTSSGVVEMARFLNFPGRTVSVRISSVGNSDHGRGRIGWNPTVILEAGGPGSIVQAQQ